MEKIIGQRGNTLLVYEGFKFRLLRKTLNVVFKWRCIDKKCTMTLNSDDSESVVLGTTGNHSHPPPVNLHREVIRNSVKRKAIEDFTERPTKLIRKEIASSSDCYSSAVTKNDVQCFSKAIAHARRSNHPPLPKSRQDVQYALNSIVIKSNKNEDMLFTNDSDNGIVVFTTKQNLEFIGQSTTILMDGTFTYCPKYFTQLFTIHSLHNDHYMPLIFCLLPDKKTETYKKVFGYVIKLCEDNGTPLQPKKVVVDFEEAILNAVRVSWPLATISGCRFHLTQAWYRHVQQKGLTNHYQNNTECGKWLHWVFGLSLLDPEEVEVAFIEDLMATVPRQGITFADYLVENYVEEQCRFPPQLWASSNLSQDRTTNACESFHSSFGKHFNAPHPNIFVFVEALKSVQVSSYVTMNTQTPRKQTNAKYLKRLVSLQQIQKDFRDGHISRFEFIKKASFYVKKSEKVKKK